MIIETEETCKKLKELTIDSTVNNSFNSSTMTHIEEIFPKALNEIESSIDKLKKCYFSFYKKKHRQEPNVNYLNSELFSENPAPNKMDIDTLKKLYFNNFHRETNDITELYNFYKEYTNLNESKAKTFRNSCNPKMVQTLNASKYSNSAAKKTQDFEDISKKSFEIPKETESSLSHHLQKLCKTNESEKIKQKLSLSLINKQLFNQKLNFISIPPTTNNSRAINPHLFLKPKPRNSKSMEKMPKKREILQNVSINNDHMSNCSLEKGRNLRDVERRKIEIEKLISPTQKKSNIFASLPFETQQKIFTTQTKIPDIEKIRNISKMFKNYRHIKSEIPVKIQEKKENLIRCGENKFLNFMENFFEKSEIEQKNIKVEKLLGKNEIDEKSFLEGLKQVSDYNNFQGSMSNDPSFNIQ